LPTSAPHVDIGAEHVLRNEAELTVPAFLRDLVAGAPRAVYATTEFCDMAASPCPRWELIDMAAYALMDVQCTRGCPYTCDFCNAAVIGGARHRVKSAAQVVAELDALADLGWRGEVFLVDDNLAATPAYVKQELLPALVERRRNGARMPLHVQAGVTLADDDELLELLFQAGVNQVFVGIESLDTHCLDECGKSQNRGRDMVADVRRIQCRGFNVMAGFIVGFDHDTPDTFARQARFIEESAVVMPVVSVLLAPPGTRLRARLECEGRIDPRGENGTDGVTNIVPRMGRTTLQDGYQWLVRQVYNPREYFRRARRFLHDAQRRPATPATSLTQLARAPRILWRLGVVDSARSAFWHFLFWTLLRRPGMLWFAMMFAVCGYHCRLHYANWKGDAH
jgi:radical SAM superfamily enzyme YgiQ (UPF0313 family)